MCPINKHVLSVAAIGWTLYLVLTISWTLIGYSLNGLLYQVNGAKGNRSANTTCLNCFWGTKKHLLAICSKNSGNKGNISNKCKKNPTPTLSKLGWERGAGDRTRRPSGTGTRCARPSPGPLLRMDQRHKQRRHPEWGAFAVGADKQSISEPECAEFTASCTSLNVIVLVPSL